MSANDEINAQIRRAAGIGVEPPQTEEQEPEPPDPDFGAGAGQRGVQPEPSMSQLMRQALYGPYAQ